MYKCTEKSSGEDVAVKVMMRRHNKKEDVEREVEILKDLNHPCLLQYMNYKVDGGNYILITEL